MTQLQHSIRLTNLITKVIQTCNQRDNQRIPILLQQIAKEPEFQGLLDVWNQVDLKLEPYILKIIGSHQLVKRILHGQLHKYNTHLDELFSEKALRATNYVLLQIKPEEAVERWVQKIIIY